MGGVPNKHVEAKRRAIFAATEYLASGKGKHGLGITALCAKWKVQHQNNVYQEVKFIEQHRDVVSAINIVSETAPETIHGDVTGSEHSD